MMNRSKPRIDWKYTLAALASVSTFFTVAHAETDPNELVPVQVTWDQKIPMRDGVKLSATIYRNPTNTAPLPVIVTFTPYIAAHAATQGSYFARNGYVFVAIDLRGRGNSEGVFVPTRVEGKDGYDAIEWIAKQPWCNGAVATWGGSWLGFTQWSIAKEMPPHLKAIAPTSAVYPGVDYPQPNGVFMSYMLTWLSYVHGHALNDGLFGLSEFWRNAEFEQVSTGRSFADLETITGMKGTVFQTWIRHPREDAYWQAATPSAKDFANLRIPVLTIAGHYDADQLGALTYYDRHLANGPKEITDQHLLMIGPWSHSGTRRPTESLGGLEFGPTAKFRMEALHKAWYDHVLKGGPRPEQFKDRVACFIMGRNVWVYASSLDKIEGGTPLKLQLDVAGAAAGDVTRTGRLSDAKTTPATVALTSDPKFLPTHEELAREDSHYLKDQHVSFIESSGRLVLHSAAFPTEMVLAGRSRLHIQLAVDQPDADLSAELFEILPDGSAVRLTGTNVRLRYRKGGVAAAAMVPGQPERVDFPLFDFFARAIAKGSRIRLVVDAEPQFGLQRNTNTGGDLAIESISKGRVAKITIITGGDSGSVLELPRPDESVVK